MISNAQLNDSLALVFSSRPIKMSPRFVLGPENVPCVAEVVNRSLKADCTDFYDQNFQGGRGDGWGGGISERHLKWGGGGSLRDVSENILKQGMGKGKVLHRGEGVLKASPPLPPPGKF